MKCLFQILLISLCLSSVASDSQDLASFQKVWEIIRDKHWDLEATGLDWDEVYRTYKPRIEAATSRTETRKILAEMIGELGQSHFNILEADSSEEVEALRARYSGSAWPGFHAVAVDGRAFIAQIDEGSEAWKHGLRIGYELVEARGEAVAPIVAKVEKAFAQMNHKELYMPAVINGIFSGYVGETIELVAKKDDKTSNVSLTLSPPKGVLKNLMQLSGIYYLYESRVLPDNLGYVAFNVFVPDVGPSFNRDMLGKLKHTEGLILDLRGNPGGLGILAVTVANRLVSKRGKLGHMKNKGGTLNFPVFPQKPSYDAPVAILIDGGSASTSEILAAGLRDLGRARIFGTNSAGAALPSLVEILPNNDRFQYAVAEYVGLDGKPLEGTGITPDEVTPHSLASLARGEDAAMAAATQWIKQQNQAGE